MKTKIENKVRSALKKAGFDAIAESGDYWSLSLGLELELVPGMTVYDFDHSNKYGSLKRVEIPGLTSVVKPDKEETDYRDNLREIHIWRATKEFCAAYSKSYRIFRKSASRPICVLYIESRNEVFLVYPR